MIGTLLIGLALLNTPASQFEGYLGFDLPEPYVWRSELAQETPLQIDCEGPEDAPCPHGEGPHLDYVGTVAQALYAPHWQGAPGFRQLLQHNGWQPVEAQGDGAGYSDDGSPSTGLLHPLQLVPPVRMDYENLERMEPDICYRRIEFATGYLDAVGLTMHIYPCASEPVH